MSRSIFVSYVFEDKAYFAQVKAWADQGRLGDVVVIGESRDVRQDGDAAVAAHLRSRIQGAAAVLVLVGADTHNHDWVRYELSVATSMHKVVLAMRIPDTTGLAPLDFRRLSLLPFTAKALHAALG